MRIAFEPLNPIIMNEDAFIVTLDEAVRLIHDVGRANFGLMLDLWHVWDEPSIGSRIAELDRELLFGIQFGDWPKGGPRHIGDRLLPGDGVIPLSALFAAIEKTGYDGAYCLEIFSFDELEGSLWLEDGADVLRRGRQGFEKAWAARSSAQASC